MVVIADEVSLTFLNLFFSVSKNKTSFSQKQLFSFIFLFSMKNLYLCTKFERYEIQSKY